MLVLAALMFYERMSFHNHTFLQLFVGAITGIVFAYLVILLRDQIEINIMDPKDPKDPKKIDQSNQSSLILGAK